MPEPETTSARRILVVDDSSLNRNMLTDFIDLLGHEVATAPNGQIGLEYLRSHPVDTVLLDIDMPVMTGIEVLEHVSQDEELKHVPIIVISGHDDMEHVVKAIGLGATDFLSKPFNPTILEARLKSSLEKKDLRDRERELLHSLEKSYADLRAAEESRDNLTHMIVHDLGNPLAVVTMNTEMLDMAAKMGMEVTPDALKERLGRIATASNTMGLMIQGILDVSKLEDGLLTPSPESVDVASFLSSISDQYRMAAADRSIAIEVSVAPEGLTCVTDRTLLERIIVNLLSNAFKYATSATALRLAATAHGEQIHIAVEDNGEGIPPELHTRIFDKFFQTEAHPDGVKAGVGLGLAFCKMATRVMGGDIQVETALPHGSRFVISLPLE
ncbi:response regulator [bacterium]|nr:response regulator [bacterium]